MTRPVRVYQEDWWPFRNLPNALERFERERGIKTELVWDKAGVGLIETMFDKMVRSFTDDDPPFYLVCCDEVMLPLTRRCPPKHSKLSAVTSYLGTALKFTRPPGIQGRTGAACL